MDASIATQIAETAVAVSFGVISAAVVHGRTLRKRLGQPPENESLSTLMAKAVATGEANGARLLAMATDIETLREDVSDIKLRLDGEAENVRQVRREVETIRDGQREAQKRLHDLEVSRLAHEARSTSWAERLGKVEGRMTAISCAKPIDGQAACRVNP